MMVWLGGFFAHLLYVHLLANRVHVTADTSFENQPRIAALDLNGMLMCYVSDNGVDVEKTQSINRGPPPDTHQDNLVHVIYTPLHPTFI